MSTEVRKDNPTSHNNSVILDYLVHSEDKSINPELKKFIDALPHYRRDVVEKPNIFVGTGTCGLGAGAAKTVKAIEKYISEKEIEAEVVKVGCIGFCSAEPLVDIQLPGKCRISYANITEDLVESLLESLLIQGKAPAEGVVGQFRNDNLSSWDSIIHIDEHPFFKPQTRLVMVNCGMMNPVSLEEYVARGGYKAFVKTISSHTREEVCDLVEKSGLRGRGGGGFPTGKKWKFALREDSEQKYMICNADEGDPGAFMDRALIEGDPHRLLEGLSIAAYAIGASKAYIYIRAEYPLAIKHLKIAIADAEKAGLLGENILDSGFSLNVIIKMGAGAFVCGEETALINSIEGKRGMPRPRPPFPAVSGLFGKPTIINNVETLSVVPEVLKHDQGWYSSYGTESSKGTKVFALSGKVRYTGLVEVVMGTKVSEIIWDIGGGIPNDKKFKAVQMGGPSGGCIPEQHKDIEIDYESLKTVGAMMGSGGMVVMDEDTCMVDVAKFFMDFIQRESCGKCIPCREGTRRMLEILEAITRGRRSENGIEGLERFRGVINLEKLAKVIRETSLCGLGQTAPSPVLSTLRWFRDEYEAHIFDRHCDAGVCSELLEYEIDADLCTGCTLCARKCPTDAIMGAVKTPHYIIQDKCIGCGQCYNVCKFKAVTVS